MLDHCQAPANHISKGSQKTSKNRGGSSKWQKTATFAYFVLFVTLKSLSFSSNIFFSSDPKKLLSGIPNMFKRFQGEAVTGGRNGTRLWLPISLWRWGHSEGMACCEPFGGPARIKSQRSWGKASDGRCVWGVWCVTCNSRSAAMRRVVFFRSLGKAEGNLLLWGLWPLLYSLWMKHVLSFRLVKGFLGSGAYLEDI